MYGGFFMRTEEQRRKQREYYRKWRSKNYDAHFRAGGNEKKVLERDGWACQKCGMKNEEHIKRFGRRLDIHHIDGNGRHAKIQNNSLDNLIALCLICHGSIEGKKQMGINKPRNNGRKRE